LFSFKEKPRKQKSHAASEANKATLLMCKSKRCIKGVDVNIHLFLTSTIERNEWCASGPGAFAH